MLASPYCIFICSSNSIVDILNIINKLFFTILTGLNPQISSSVKFPFIFSLTMIHITEGYCMYFIQYSRIFFLHWINRHQWVSCERWQSDEWLWCLWNKVTSCEIKTESNLQAKLDPLIRCTRTKPSYQQPFWLGLRLNNTRENVLEHCKFIFAEIL